MVRAGSLKARKGSKFAEFLLTISRNISKETNKPASMARYQREFKATPWKKHFKEQCLIHVKERRESILQQARDVGVGSSVQNIFRTALAFQRDQMHEKNSMECDNDFVLSRVSNDSDWEMTAGSESELTIEEELDILRAMEEELREMVSLYLCAILTT